MEQSLNKSAVGLAYEDVAGLTDRCADKFISTAGLESFETKSLHQATQNWGVVKINETREEALAQLLTSLAYLPRRWAEKGAHRTAYENQSDRQI